MQCVIVVFPDHTRLLFLPETPTQGPIFHRQTPFVQIIAQNEHFGPVDFEFERGDY